MNKEIVLTEEQRLSMARDIIKAFGLAALGFILFGFMVWQFQHETQVRHDKIYNACIADGQKPYYCESLASRR